MERWSGRVALVTGASAGIGFALAELLVKHGMKVIGCARNISKIEILRDNLKTESGSLLPIKCDLAKTSEIDDMFTRIRQEFGRIDVLVNNAGLSHDAPLLSGSTEHFRNMLNINVLAVTVCTREAFKLMREQKIDDGHIININSMSGHRVIPMPAGHFYSATKFALRALTEGIRNELRAINSHIRISQISPGLVVTEFSERAVGKEKAEQRYNSMEKCLEAKDIADSVIYVLSAPSHVQVHDVCMRSTFQMS